MAARSWASLRANLGVVAVIVWLGDVHTVVVRASPYCLAWAGARPFAVPARTWITHTGFRN
jgi:hypothetical protein